MSHRSLPPLKLPHLPLIFVLAQVRISPVLEIEAKIPAIQEALRKSGYPLLSRRKVHTATFGPDAQTQSMQTKEQWEFLNKEKRASLLVDAEGLTFQVTRYDGFNTFLAGFRSALEVFARLVEPNLIQRVGLRYVDLVLPTEGKELSSYFSAELRGFKIQDSDNRKAFFSETVCQTGENRTFVHRYSEAEAGLGFPPDLLPVNLTFPTNIQVNSPFGLLDLDHFLIQDEDFSVEAAITQLEELHTHHRKAFETSVTDTAIEEWKQP